MAVDEDEWSALHPWGKSVLYALDRRVGKPQNQSGPSS